MSSVISIYRRLEKIDKFDLIRHHHIDCVEEKANERYKRMLKYCKGVDRH